MGNLWGGVSLKEPSTLEECDSTWETDSGSEEEEEPGCRERQQQEHPQGRDQEEEEEGGEQEDSESQQSDLATEQIVKPKRSFYAARDLYKYRHQFPQNFKDLRGQNDLCNLRFYLNKIPLKPDGVYIEEILNKWKGDYDKLEHNHTYIQWLFPLREQGLNFYAKELTTFEIEEFRKTKEAIKRFMLAYRMMLDFFGIKLIDKTGNVTRATNWQERFQHLNESQHNYLRITRILKSLGELGYENFKSPLVKIFLQEALIENTIRNIKQSALEYFVYTIRDRRERRKLLRFARRHYQPPEHFIWGPQGKQKFEVGKPLSKPSSPCAPKCHFHVPKKSKDAKCSPKTCSPKVKTPCQKRTESKQNEVISDSAGSETNSDDATQNINKKQGETENLNCESKGATDSLADTEYISQAQKSEVEGEPDAVDQECENLQTKDHNVSVKDSTTHLKANLPAESEVAQLSVSLVPEDQKNS